MADRGRNKGVVAVIIRPQRINSEGKTSVFVRYTYDGTKKLFGTGVMARPEDFKNEDNRWTKSKLHNNVIYDLKSRIHDAIRNLETRKIIPHVDNVVHEIEKPEESHPLFFPTLKEHINNIPVKKNREDKDREARDQLTINNYNSLVANLKDFFQNTGWTEDSTFIDQVDLKFYKDFKAFLTKVKGHKVNTIGTRIKCLKSLLRELKDLGYPVTDQLSKFSVPKTNKVKFFMKQSELEHLYNFNFPDNHAALARYRDVFCFQACTGLRISDLKRFNKKHLNGSVIEMTAYKTNSKLHIPLTPMAAKILLKHDYVLPINGSDKNYEVLLNRHIKRAFKIAGLDRSIEMSITKGTEQETQPLYELVTSHTAVKTFITHCFEKNIPAADISIMTGKDLKTILNHYYSADQDDVTRRMQLAFGSISI